MASLKIRRDVMEKARSRANLTAAEREAIAPLFEQNNGKGAIVVSTKEVPEAFLRSLLDDTRLTANLRAQIAMRIHGMTGNRGDLEEVYKTTVANTPEFVAVFETLSKRSPNCEVFRNGRWYPVIFNVELLKSNDELGRIAFLNASLSICEANDHVRFYITQSLFTSQNGESRERTVADILRQFGLRPVQTSPTEFNLKLLRAERCAAEAARMVTVTGPAMVMNNFFWWSGMESRTLGSEKQPVKAIVEPELEVAEGERCYYGRYAQTEQAVSRLPFVRLFCMDLKTYVYVDVDDIQEYEYDDGAMSRLHLPAKMLKVLTQVFSTPVESLFGDLIDGKHGGVVVLACGSPGVGKTLTAEVYAEQTHRPLYSLELGELGTDAAEVEDRLRRVFTRVARWNAVLQFDECEIFLTERGEDLERSAIVGIFLRLLDYYQGILFLTTNRPQVIDHAILSRVMLRLDYPDLDHDARAGIWRSMFQSAGLTLLGGEFEELANVIMNGRQIRNLTRLASILHPDGEVQLEDMWDVLEYGSWQLAQKPPASQDAYATQA